MNKPRSRTSTLLVFGALIVAAFIVVAILVKFVILPWLPPEWRTNMTWLGATAITAIGVSASLAQVLGISLKDFFSTSKDLPPQIDRYVEGSRNIAVNVEKEGQVNLGGDILQNGSIKIVITGQQAESTQPSISDLP